MSGKQARRRRQAPVPAPPPVRRKGERRRASTRVLVIVAVAGLLLAGVAVGVAVAFSGGNSSSSTVPTRGSVTNAAALPNAADAAAEFAGIPQHGMFLGSAKAPVDLVQYIDLQCPFCRDFETLVMPSIVRRYVRTGKVRVETRPIAIIGPDSLPARNAAIAAGRQNRAFPFMQVTYLNQGTENTGWLTKDFITHAAASVPGMDVQRVLTEMDSASVAALGHRFDSQAQADAIPGTPALFVGKRGQKPRLVPTAQVQAAIQQALR